MNKKVLLILITTVCVVCIGIFLVDAIMKLMNDGYAHYGDTWQDTPEKALKKHADYTVETLQTLTPQTVLCTKCIDDIVEMTFVSVGDTLVTVTFVTNDKGQYSVYGYTEELGLDDPGWFVLTGDPRQFDFNAEQFILVPYDSYNTTVWGWCYTECSFTVNGVNPFRETYVFDCQGKTWSLDYWWIVDVPSESEVTIEYIS